MSILHGPDVPLVYNKCEKFSSEAWESFRILSCLSSCRRTMTINCLYLNPPLDVLPNWECKKVDQEEEVTWQRWQGQTLVGSCLCRIHWLAVRREKILQICLVDGRCISRLSKRDGKREMVTDLQILVALAWGMEGNEVKRTLLSSHQGCGEFPACLPADRHSQCHSHPCCNSLEQWVRKPAAVRSGSCHSPGKPYWGTAWSWLWLCYGFP